MRTLNFTVEGDHLTKTGDFSHIVRGSHGWLECSFSFSDDWRHMRIAAVFTADRRDYAAPVVRGVCQIPDQVAQQPYFKMKLVGRVDGTERNTNRVLIEQEG